MANDLARWQFATTSIYHFIFIPATIRPALDLRRCGDGSDGERLPRR